jgi:hypothetical protein
MMQKEGRNCIRKERRRGRNKEVQTKETND